MNQSSKEQRSPMHDSVEPRVYPMNYIIGIINTKEDVDNAVKSLHEAGFAEDAIDLFTGEEFVKQIDPSGEYHGLKWRIIRALQHLGGEGEIYDRFKEAMLAGYYTISVPGKELETREQAKKILKEHNAYDLHFFGKGAIEDL